MKKWEVVANSLRDGIAHGEPAPGERMPTTHALAREHSTSRATIAIALARLGREGWIYYRGDHHGWAVTEPARRRRLSRNRLGRNERARGRGFFLTDAAGLRATPDVVTTVSTVGADDDVASRLEIPPGDAVVQRHRVHLLDGKPAQRAIGSIPATIAAGTPISEQHPGEGGIVGRLHDMGHGPATHIERVTPSRIATDGERDTLELAPESGVCEIVRVSYDNEDGPVLTEHIVVDPRSVELVYEIPTD